MPVKKSEPKTINALTVNVTQPTIDDKAMTSKAEQLSSLVNGLTIKDQESYNAAASILVTVKQHIEYLSGIFGPSKSALNAAIKKLKDDEKRLVGHRMTFAVGLEEAIKGKMGRFLIEEENKKRKEAEEKRLAEEKRVAAEKKKLEKQAERAEDKGKDAKAEQLRLEAAAIVPAPVAVEKAVSFAGTGTGSRDDISVEIVDPRLFLRYLLDSGADVSTLIEFKYSKVKEFVKGIEIMPGEEIQKAPGIKVEKRKIISASK